MSSPIELNGKSLSDYLPKPQVVFPEVPQGQQPYLKKVFVQTWGCQMNVADTERMLALLGQCNYRPTPMAEDADLVLLNTCHIREKARHKVVSRLGELKHLKDKRPETVFAVAGCVAQAEAKILARTIPYLDLVFGPDQIEQLPQLLEAVAVQAPPKNPRAPKPPLLKTGFQKDPYSIPTDVVPPWTSPENQEVSRFVNIIKGCNNFCTFCVVPFTRGREKSRPQGEILEETRFFIANGVKEIVLLGQNVNSYGLDLVDGDAIGRGEMPFADLIEAVAQVEGVERVRFTTSNPHDFTPRLAQVFARQPKLCNSFHLPVQSGSTPVLERMNRQYTRAQYLERVAWIRDVRPQVAFSTDIIVGFPGETESDFEDTMSLVQEMKYAFIYAFAYSPRRGTAAARFVDQVDEKVKSRRLQKLLAWQKEETTRQNQAEIGQTRDVLILYKSSKHSDSWFGRTFEGRLVRVVSDAPLLGELLPVKIVDANATALLGHPI